MALRGPGDATPEAIMALAEDNLAGDAQMSRARRSEHASLFLGPLK